MSYGKSLLTSGEFFFPNFGGVFAFWADLAEDSHRKKNSAKMVQHLLKGNILHFKESIKGMNLKTRKIPLSDQKILSMHYLSVMGSQT